MDEITLYVILNERIIEGTLRYLGWFQVEVVRGGQPHYNYIVSVE